MENTLKKNDENGDNGELSGSLIVTRGIAEKLQADSIVELKAMRGMLVNKKSYFEYLFAPIFLKLEKSEVKNEKEVIFFTCRQLF